MQGWKLLKVISGNFLRRGYTEAQIENWKKAVMQRRGGIFPAERTACTKILRLELLEV